MPSVSRIIRIILISILVIFDVAAVGFVLISLRIVSVFAVLFCDSPGATVDQCVGSAMPVFLPSIVLFVYAPLFTVFVLVM
jgi:hypothetical protein